MFLHNLIIFPVFGGICGLYKTTLSDDGFHSMLQTILESEQDVKPYGDEEETIH